MKIYSIQSATFLGANVLGPLALAFATTALIAVQPAAAQPVNPDRPSAEPRNILADLTPVDGGMTADEAARLGAKASPTVWAANAAAVQASRASSIGAVAFAPRLDISANYTRLSRIDIQPFEFGGMEIDIFPQILNNYSLRAGVRVPVTDYFLTILPRYRASKHAAELARHQAAAERQAAALRARDAFYLLVGSRAQAAVAADAIRLLENYRSDIEAFVAAGQSTKADLLAAEAQLADARVQLARAEGGIAIAAEQLRRLLDLPAGEPIAVGEAVFGPVDTSVPSKEDLLAKALSSRHEVKALRALAEVQRHSVTAAKGARLPSLAIVGNYNYANPNQRAVPAEEKWAGTWDAGVVLSWSPNDFVAGRVNVESLELDVIRAKSDLANLEDQIAIEAESALSDLNAAVIRLTATRQGVVSATEAWEVRRDLLGAGEAIASDVLDAQNALLRAQLAEVDAFIAARRARARINYLVAQSV